jgi:hypothetical protein
VLGTVGRRGAYEWSTPLPALDDLQFRLVHPKRRFAAGVEANFDPRHRSIAADLRDASRPISVVALQDLLGVSCRLLLILSVFLPVLDLNA